MIKKEKITKDNVVKFPSKLTDLEKEIEAVIFAAAEPLDVDTIESKISKKANVAKLLEKLQQEYSNRGINLVCIKEKWSFRTSPKVSSLMTQEKTVEKKIISCSNRNISNYCLSPTCYKSRNRGNTWCCFWNKYFRDFNGIRLG